MGHDDLLGGQGGMEEFRQRHGETATEQLGGDERRRRGRLDAGERVGQRPGEGHGRVGERRRGGEPVRGRDVAADRKGCGHGPAGAHDAQDDHEQPERGHDLAEPQPAR